MDLHGGGPHFHDLTPGDLDPPPVDPPDEPRDGGEPRTPRWDDTNYLPFLALGAGIIVVERIALLTITATRSSHLEREVAAAILIVVVGAAVFGGGTAFVRAWHAHHRSANGGRPPTG